VIDRIRKFIYLFRRSSFVHDCFRQESQQKKFDCDDLILDVIGDHHMAVFSSLPSGKTL
jgi:hypothetical protein